MSQNKKTLINLTPIYSVSLVLLFNSIQHNTFVFDRKFNALSDIIVYW